MTIPLFIKLHNINIKQTKSAFRITTVMKNSHLSIMIKILSLLIIHKLLQVVYKILNNFIMYQILVLLSYFEEFTTNGIF